MLYSSYSGTGVYSIFNKHNHFIYIGSASNRKGIKDRITTHLSRLRAGKHHSPILQKHFERYGEDAFEVYVLEECLPEQCLQFEQAWIDEIGVGSKNKSYNICKKAGSAPNRLGIKQKPESIAKRQKSLKDNPLPKQEMDRIRLLSIDKISKDYIVTTPEGKEIYIKNLKAFCREHELNPTHMIQTAKGFHMRHKGWRCRYAEATPEWEQEAIGLLISKSKVKKFIITSPSGEEYTVENLTVFCAANNLCRTTMSEVAHGEVYSHKGWLCRLIGETEEVKQKRENRKPRGYNRQRKYVATLPTGETVEFFGLQEFCRKHNLDARNLHAVVKGKAAHHRGYTCRYAD